jgi:hypothetical protein
LGDVRLKLIMEEDMNKVKLLGVIALIFLGSGAFAGATIEGKESKSNGSNVGKAASSCTGCGDVVGGNGTSGMDQTTAPGSRADAVQGLHAAEGRGRDKE